MGMFEDKGYDGIDFNNYKNIINSVNRPEDIGLGNLPSQEINNTGNTLSTMINEEKLAGIANQQAMAEIAMNNKGLGDIMNIVNNAGSQTKPVDSSGDYFSLLLDKESTNNYKAVNRFNYLGGYQMGAQALVEAGLVKRGTTNKQLDNPKNWIGNLNKDKFLNTPSIQDEAVRIYTNKNKKYLGDLFTKASPEEKAGLLGSAHVIGAGATKKDMNRVDGNGVSGNDRYKTFYGSSF